MTGPVEANGQRAIREEAETDQVLDDAMQQHFVHLGS